MPTPVGTARQCLADTAAAVLDDAVAVAKRRSHGQTTSLHVVYALLALPSSALREACTRAWSSAYSPRLQFRALELSVGVALDRVSVSKSAADEPPVSNSLMAAIKRSQANQRRHPETFHLYQQMQLSSSSQDTPSISAVKVELKHFLMSILDDPIVSRVFGDAGFRTQEIKLAVLNPLAISRFAATASRPPPLFPCSLDNTNLIKRTHSFPFYEAATNEKFNENSRIGEVLLRKTGRNPLLIGVCGKDACKTFLDCLKSGESDALPKEVDGLRVISIEHEISECIGVGLSNEMMELKFQPVDESVKDCQGPGVIANCGDFKAFLDVELVDIVSNVFSKLKKLLINHGGKLWLIGFLTGDDDYKKLLEQFPSFEMDLDLHLLPITNSSMGRKPFKSSLMRSFVPFGGFFPLSSELIKSPCTEVTEPMGLCSSCNEKYEQEVSDVQKGVSVGSFADKQSMNTYSWLQNTECETSKRSCTEEAKKDRTVLDARVMTLKRKWSAICQRLHSSQPSQVDTTLPKLHTPMAPSLQHDLMQKDAVSVGSFSGRSSVTNLSPCMPSDWQKSSPPKRNVAIPAELSASVIAQGEIPEKPLGLNDFQKSYGSQRRTNLPIPFSSSSAVISVATDLTLGTFYDSSEERRRNPNLQERCSDAHTSESSRSHEKSSSQMSQSSPCSHRHGKQMYLKDLEKQWGVLAEKVYWQSEAIQTIGRTVSRCRKEDERCRFSRKGSIWLSFLGPDKVGKRKIAASMAEMVFGGKDLLLYMDLSTQDMNQFNCIVDCYDSRFDKMQSGRKLTVDYLAEELSKKPHSVVLLENVERADFLLRCNLSRAVKTGKFPDSHGRDINLDDNIFILASTVLKGSKDLVFGKEAPDFPEETILEAKNMQMQIFVESGFHICTKSSSSSSTRVSLFRHGIISNEFHSSKRKMMNGGSTKGELPKRACPSTRSFIDLNLPGDDMGEDTDVTESDDSEDSEVWLEELLKQVDENVVSKPFDFDCLSRKILRGINERVRKIVGSRMSLQIDRQVMAQIVAAAWVTEREEAVEDWIEQVLCSAIDEAHRRCNVGGDSVLKLVPCDGVAARAQASGVCLPARINVD